jgi:hypothetical protein
MSVVYALLFTLLQPNQNYLQVGIWAHWDDTLVIFSDSHYFTNCDAIRWMCGSSGECKLNSKDAGFLVGQCQQGARLEVRGLDTMFVVTSDAWIPFTRVPIKSQKPTEPIKSSKPRNSW